MNIIIRQPNDNDVELYKHCFSNQEFHHNIYNDEPLDIEHYGNNNKRDLKFVLETIVDNVYRPTGFANFYYDSDNNIPTFVGGIIPEKINSGLGVYLNIAIFDYLFSNNIVSTIYSGVYKFNTRSYKMLLALGFKLIDNSQESYELQISKKDFDNGFVNHLKHKCLYKKL